MKRFISMLLVCLMVLQMFPMGIHTHAHETETIPAETVETMAVTEETALPPETSIAREAPTTEPVPEADPTETVEEATPPTTAETVPETECSVPVFSSEDGYYQLILDSITNDPAEETDETETHSEESHVMGTLESTTRGVNDHTYYEGESNNDWSLADLVENDYTVIASIGGIDTDFFAMRLNYKSKVTILAVAKKSSFGMGFYDSSEKLLAKDITGTRTDDGNYSYTMSGTYSAGKYYYVTLDSNKSSSYNYIFYVEIEPLYLSCKHSSKKKVETVEPTCGSQGYTEYYCKTCDYTWKDKIVPATGKHMYYDQYDSICDACKSNRYLGIARGECGDPMNWVIYDDGRMVVSGWGDMQLNNGNGMPWDSYKSRIKSLEVRDEVFRISDHAFENCTNLTSITLAGSVLNIENGAFRNCTSLSGVTLGEGVRRIGDESFGGCTALTSIRIPSTVTEIDSGAFVLCGNLESFNVASGNPVYSSDSQGILYNKDKTETVLIPEGIRGTVTIPTTLSEIPSFAGRTKLTGVVIPEGFTKIPKSCFTNCLALKNVQLPGSITEIHESAFYRCTALQQIALPQSVTYIGLAAFEECTALSSIALPDKLSEIAYRAFFNCRALKKITFSKNVTYICKEAFWDAGLKEITFEGNAPIIDWNAFSGVIATVYYPITDTTWNSSTKLDYDGNLTWIGACIGGHVEVIDVPGFAPTCTEEGLSPDSHCSNCGEIVSVQQVLPALGHDVIIDAYLAPTCLETGLTEGKHCGRCAEVLTAQKAIPALGHTTVVDAYLAPTCEETGLTEGSHCGRCGHVHLAQQIIPALGHSYTDHWCDNCGRAEFVEVISIETDAVSITSGQQANLTAVLDYAIREETEIIWTLAEGDAAYATLEAGRETAVLTAQRLLEDATVTVSAKTADGLHDPVSIRITIRGVDSDHDLFAGKSLTLKPINPATGKAYTAKQLTWSLDERYVPFASVKNGKVTAQKVVQKERVQVTATVNATGEKLQYVIDIFPAITQLEVSHDGAVANGKTLLMDYSDKEMVLTADLFPVDLTQSVTWTISDKKSQYADYEISGNTLTISNPKGKAGTVTINATVNAGVKKTATVKVQFGTYARAVEILSPTGTTLRGGETLMLSAYISDPVGVTKPGIVWSVSDKTAATVSGGTVKAKNVAHPTTVTVTATSKDGQASASLDLEILPKNEGQLVLMCDGSFVTNTTKAMSFGDTWQLSAAIITNGISVPQAVTWTTSKEAVAYVSEGLITATGVGTAKVTAEYGGQKAVVTVKVSTLVKDMEITTKDGKNLIEENGETMVLVSSGKSVNLAANILTGGAAKAVAWEITEGAGYAKIASSGKLTANKDLTSVQYITVKVTAKDGGNCSETIRVKILPLATGVQIYENGSSVRSNTTYVCDMLTTPTLKLNARVYPAKANQAVELTSSNKKIADFNENGELVCIKPGTVTITAKALDGSNAKTTFKLTIIKRITELKMNASLPVDENGNFFVAGGKSLKLAPMIEISPSDATNKKLSWSVSPNDYGIKINASGVLSTKKVTQPVTVNVMVLTQDGSGKMLSFNVLVYPT